MHSSTRPAAGAGIFAFDVRNAFIVHNTANDNTNWHPAVGTQAGIRFRNSLNGLVSYNHTSGNRFGLFVLPDVPGQIPSSGNAVIYNISRYNELGDLTLNGPAGSVTAKNNILGTPGQSDPPQTPGPDDSRIYEFP